jgi:hypothetical protein
MCVGSNPDSYQQPGSAQHFEFDNQVYYNKDSLMIA